MTYGPNRDFEAKNCSSSAQHKCIMNREELEKREALLKPKMKKIDHLKLCRLKLRNLKRAFATGFLSISGWPFLVGELGKGGCRNFMCQHRIQSSGFPKWFVVNGGDEPKFV
jgi:hypothetical protein